MVVRIRRAARFPAHVAKNRQGSPWQELSSTDRFSSDVVHDFKGKGPIKAHLGTFALDFASDA